MTEEAAKTVVPVPTSFLANEDPHLHKVVVTNLKKGTTAEQLKAWIIEKSGIEESGFVSFEVAAPKNAEKKTDIAKITFDSTVTTDTAIAKVMKLEGKDRQLDEFTVNIRRDIPQFIWDDPKLKAKAFSISKKLFVAGLPKSGCDWEAELKATVGRLVDSDETKILGEIEEFRVIMDKDASTGDRLETCKGFGFIHVTSEGLADKLAIQCASGLKIGGQDVTIKKDQPKDKDGTGMRGGMRGGRGGFMQRGGMMPRGGMMQRGRGFPRGGRGGYAAPHHQGWGYDQQQGYGGGYGNGYGQESWQGGWGYGNGYEQQGYW